MLDAPLAEGDDKYACLKARLAEIASSGANPRTRPKRLAIAFSGGLDSRFLAYAAINAEISVLALHVNGPHVPAREHARAKQWAQENNVPLVVLPLDPLDNPLLKNNPKDRCYHCKTAMLAAVRQAAGALPVCDGGNASDLAEYRPGIKAVREQGVFSPLAETEFTKADIQRIGAQVGLDNPEQAAQPCLLTRFDYGAELDAPMLAATDKAEEAALSALAAQGILGASLRFRHERAGAPSLHIAGGALREAALNDVAAALARAGFPNTPIRVVDSLSGFFDRKSGAA